MFINQPTYMDTFLISSSLLDSSVVLNVRVSEFISDHGLVLCQLDFISPSVPRSKKATFWRYHKIKMDNLRSDLANCSFVKCFGNTASVLYQQYTSVLNDLLEKHAPKVSCTFIKGPFKWCSDSYLLAKDVWCQSERIWCKDKLPQNRVRLHMKLAHCNSLANKDKSNYYRNLVIENAQDPKKLWQVE